MHFCDLLLFVFFFCIFIYLLTRFIFFYRAVTKHFRPDLSVVRPRDLNFLLHSEIFVHYDSQLRASCLILGCVPSYTSYQDPSQALTIGNPLLLYINVHLQGSFREVFHLVKLGKWALAR